MSNDSKLLTPLLKGPLTSFRSLSRISFCSRLELYLPDVERPLQKLYGHLPDYAAVAGQIPANCGPQLRRPCG